MGKIRTTTALELDAGSTLDIDSSTTLQINSAGGAISIGNDDIDQAINIGTAGERTTTIGNTVGANALALNFGTGDFTVASASGTVISQLDTGEMTKPLQPAFLAYLASPDNNVTGDGTTYTLGGTTALTEVYDQGSDFVTTGVFTAPVTGRYYLMSAMRVSGTTGAMTTGDLRIVTSNRTYFTNTNPGIVLDVGNNVAMKLEALADMDLGDTATTTLRFANGTKVADVDGQAILVSYFCGHLAC